MLSHTQVWYSQLNDKMLIITLFSAFMYLKKITITEF